MIQNGITFGDKFEGGYDILQGLEKVGICLLAAKDSSVVIVKKAAIPDRLLVPGLIQQVCCLYGPDSVYVDGVPLPSTVISSKGLEKTASGFWLNVQGTFEKLSATSKEQMVYAYGDWKSSPTKKNMAYVLRTLNPVINRELHTYKGTIPETVLRGMAKKIAIASVKNYNPNRGAALSTHLVHQLQQLHRKNYESFSTARLPEHLQRGVGGFLRAKSYLRDTLGREPTVAELADEMNWGVKNVAQIQRRLRNEVGDKVLEFDPIHSSESEEDARVDYFYNDLNPQDKIIFEHTTRYGGAEILPKKAIATKLSISPARVTQRANNIAKKFKAVFRQG